MTPVALNRIAASIAALEGVHEFHIHLRDGAAFNGSFQWLTEEAAGDGPVQLDSIIIVTATERGKVRRFYVSVDEIIAVSIGLPARKVVKRK